MRINYSKYSLDELIQARDNLNVKKYPEKLEILNDYIANFKNSPEYKKYLEQQELEKEARKYSTIVKRLFAAFIDGIFIAILRIIGSFIISRIASKTSFFYISLFVFSFDYYFYLIFMHGTYGQTIGKMICGIIVKKNIDEKPINYKMAFYREAIPVIFVCINICIIMYFILNPHKFTISTFTSLPFKFIYAASFTWFILEIITALTNFKRRALHDYIAGTVVVRDEE
ncbi:MAG: RDD family protein [Deltaproteobacteria bacterium]|nr:RDD family protein [Deltaproteobacteria bacterium]